MMCIAFAAGRIPRHNAKAAETVTSFFCFFVITTPFILCAYTPEKAHEKKRLIMIKCKIYEGRRQQGNHAVLHSIRHSQLLYKTHSSRQVFWLSFHAAFRLPGQVHPVTS